MIEELETPAVQKLSSLASSNIDRQRFTALTAAPSVVGGASRSHALTFVDAPEQGSTTGKVQAAWTPTASRQRRQVPAAPPRSFHFPTTFTGRFEVLGRWRGVVSEVRHDSFTAVLQDVERGTPREVAEFLRSEISDGDAPLLTIGAQFYWVVGFRITAARTRYRSSVIRFRRLPAWTSFEIAEADAWADDMLRFFNAT